MSLEGSLCLLVPLALPKLLPEQMRARAPALVPSIFGSDLKFCSTPSPALYCRGLLFPSGAEPKGGTGGRRQEAAAGSFPAFPDVTCVAPAWPPVPWPLALAQFQLLPVTLTPRLLQDLSSLSLQPRGEADSWAASMYPL